MSNRCSQIIILCEDKQQDSFIRRFLKKAHGIQPHNLKVIPYPASGKGSGEQFVRNNYPNELKALRSRQHRAKTTLIVAIDADKSETKDIVETLNSACTEKGIEPKNDQDNVAFVIPKRNIETWITWLSGTEVNENTPYEKLQKNESRCQPAVEKLYDLCKQNATQTDCPESIRAVCLEYRKVKAGFSA